MTFSHHSLMRFVGALFVTLLVAQQLHAGPTSYPTVTDARLERPTTAIGSCIGERMTVGASAR